MSDLLDKDGLESCKELITPLVEGESDEHVLRWLHICDHIEAQDALLDECGLALGKIWMQYSLSREHRLRIESVVRKLDARR